MHRDGHGQRAGRDQIVHDRRHGVDADVFVEAAPAQREHRVGDEIFRAQPFFDVRQVALLGLDEVGALPADAGRLGQAVMRELIDRLRRLALAGALEGVEHIVAHAGGFVVHR